MEKQVKVVVSKKEPQNKHVLWLEQDPLHEISPKLYNNGEWQNLKTVNVPEELLDKVGKLNDSVKEFDREVENFNSDITSFRNSLITETQQRMAVDSSLGNRITSVTTTANNNKTSLNNLETKLNTNIANLRAKDAELEEAITNVKNDVVPKEVAEGIASVVANAPEDLNTLKEVADYIASDKTNADKIITDISNLKTKDSTHDTEIATLKQKDTQLTNSIEANATNIAKNASDITANTEALAKQAEELETKAPKVGYAPDLKVDFAKELVGRGVAEPQKIGTIRPTGVISIGDGNATIEKVKGNSVVWNQYDKSFNITLNGVTVTSTEDGVYTLNGQATASGTFYGEMYGCKDVHPEHMALEIVEVISGEFEGVEVGKHGISHLGITYEFPERAVHVKISKFAFAYLKIIYLKGDKFTDLKFRANLHDLTQMFGAGNEPTTIEEFEARKPLGVTDEYNEGEIISYDAQELKSVGFNAFNGTYAKVIGGQQYHALGTITSIGFTTELGGETTEVTVDSEGMFTPTEDGYVYAEGNGIVIHLTHTYTPEHKTEYEEDILTLPDVKAIKDKDGNQFFPYGLLSAGSAHDEITATKAVKRIGVVDLGSLNWRYNSVDFRFVAPYSAFKVIPTNQTPNSLSSELVGYSGINFDSAKDVTKIYRFDNSVAQIYVRHLSYTDATTFKQAMQGVLLYYELATPIEVDLPEPLNLTYDAWDFGTEELIAEGKTTPLNADIVYQFNAVDRIRENSKHANEANEILKNKQDALVSGTNIKTINGESLLGEGDITIGSSEYTLVLNKTFTEDVASYDASVDVPNITSYKDFIILIEFKYQEGVSRGGWNFLLLNGDTYPKVSIVANNIAKESYRTHYILRLHVGDVADMTAYLESHNNSFDLPQTNDGNVGMNWMCNYFEKRNHGKIKSFIFGHGFITGEKLKIYAR